jgi:hypothetical protein
MTATTDQKARLLDLTTGMLELVRDGERSITDVCAVLQVIKDEQDFTAQLGSLQVFSRDMRKEGWKLIEDVGGLGEVIITDLEIISFLREGEKSVSGEVMRQRAVKLGANLGQRQAEYLLEHQDEIPREFRKYYLVFPGTLWRASDGSLVVPYLSWDDGRWYLRFHWLRGDWHSHDRLLRPRKQAVL